MPSVDQFGPECRTLARALVGLEKIVGTPWLPNVRSRSDLSFGENLSGEKLVLRGEIGLDGAVTFSKSGSTRTRTAFLWDIASEKIPLPVTPSHPEFFHWWSIHNRAKFRFELLMSELGRQISVGHLTAIGRPGSPIAPKKVLAPDMWANLKVEDWTNGTVLGPHGEVIFSVHLREETPSAPELASVERVAIGPLTKRQKVARLLGDHPLDVLEAATAKQLWRLIEARWQAAFGSNSAPADDTLKRAQRDAINLAARHA